MNPPVLIVGAGPAGLTAACALRRFGVACRVVDRRGSRTEAPKALVLWSGALEALRRTGVADQLVEAALPLRGASYFAGRRRLGRVRFGGLTGTAFPAPLCVPQPVTERLLDDRLSQLGGEVEWGTELVDLTEPGDAVTVELRRADGAVERTSVPWVVGADGTHSRVREAVRIGYHGHTYERVFLLADGRLAGPAPADEAEYHLHPDGVLVVVPLPGGGHRVFFDLAADGGGDGADPPDPALLQRLLDSRGPGSLRIAEIWWSSQFRVHARMADRFRQGRTFLAGDAAHCHSPAGGQGLNTGVQDGYDLGWKLASVLRGADPSVLDSYQAERRPASARAVRNADRQTRLWMARSPVRRAVRDLLLRRLFRLGVLERKLVPQLAQLDLDHSASPGTVDLTGAATPPGVRRGRRMPDTALVPADPAGPGTLHDYLAAGRHVLLVGGGGAAAGSAVAEAVSWVAERRVGDIVDVLWLRPPGAAIGSAAGADLLDEAAPAPLTGGGRAPWFCYLRPDAVVAARAGLDQVGSVLARLPQHATPGVAA